MASEQLDPAHISAAMLAQVISKAGGVKIDANVIEADITSGAPTNADGTLNLVHYTAWLAARVE